MKKIWYYLLLLLIVSFFIDEIVLNFFINNRVGFLDKIIVFFTNPYLLIFTAIVLSILLFKKKKKVILLFLIGYTGFFISNLLKLIISRARPSVLSLINVNTNSFPSSHATVVFALLPFFIKEFKKFRWLWLGAAILIILSRLYVGVHYLSDLVGGIILGLVIGTKMIKK